MNIAAQVVSPTVLNEAALSPDPWDDDWGIRMPLDHVICRELDGTPHTVGEFIWPWTAYTSHQRNMLFCFTYWKNKPPRSMVGFSAERVARMRELQFLMTRQIYFGNQCSAETLRGKIFLLRKLARFAETRSCSVRDVFTQGPLLDSFGSSLTGRELSVWMSWYHFLSQLDPANQLGFTIAVPERWQDLVKRARVSRNIRHQTAPLPTRIYAAFINNLSTELDEIEAHKDQLLTMLREAVKLHKKNKLNTCGAFELIEQYGLCTYFDRLKLESDGLRSLGRVLYEIFIVCKLQIHVFSGMRDKEACFLPYHCMETEDGFHGRKHNLIAGTTTKFNKGRRLRTKWVTTEAEGFRAIRLAQEFADFIYEMIGVVPSDADDKKDNYPLFPTPSYLPWMPQPADYSAKRFMACAVTLNNRDRVESLLSRLCPLIEGEDIAELEDIDPFRAWREEQGFAIGRRWHLTTHQLRRSLAVYANASGLVRISSLRRQLQHLTREMALYYGRGSTFCKNFIKENPTEYKNHVAVQWQNGEEEAAMLAFVRDVLNSTEPMFGGAGKFYERQRKTGEVISRKEIAKQMKAGVLDYREGPLGGCTRPSMCETRKGLNLIDTTCATKGCKHLIGKHSKIVETIKRKKMAMTHITHGSITEAMELEDLASLERIERQWRPQEKPAGSARDKYV